MSKAKKIFLLNERRETWRIRLRGQQKGYCPGCDQEVWWLTARASVEVLNMTEREVVRLAESDAIHSREDGAGFLFICQVSLERFGKEIRS